MNRVGSWIRNSRFARLLLVVPCLIAGLLLYLVPAYGADLPARSVLMSDNRVSAVATYLLSFTIPAPETLGSIKLQFCSNDPLFSDPCTAPAGFDISAATLAAQGGETGFSVFASGTDANTIVLARAPSLAAAGGVSYTFDTVTNPNVAGTFYARLQTFASGDASGADNDHGGMALSINGAINVSTTVPPFLLFCSGVTIGGLDCGNASGNYINFGNVNDVTTASAQSQLLTTTNAAFGYTISVTGSTMTSGNNIIDAIASADVARPGTAQFGLNLVANVTPAVGANPAGPGSAAPLPNYSQPDFFRYVPGDAIASANTSDDYKKLTASYIIDIPSGQPIGVYATTLTYICLANF